MAIVVSSDVLMELGLSSGATAEEIAVVASCIKRAEGAIKRFLHYDPSSKSRTEYYPQQDIRSSGDGMWEVNDTEAYIRSLSGASTNELQLQCIPVRSIESLYIDYDGRSGTKDGAFSEDCLKIEGVDYWANFDQLDSSGDKVCMDGILRSQGLWPTTPGCVKVIYTAGYTADELQGNDDTIDASPIWEVALDEACRRVRKMFSLKKNARVGFVPGVLVSENLGDYSYSIDAASAKQTASESDLLSSSKEKLMSFLNFGSCLGG